MRKEDLHTPHKATLKRHECLKSKKLLDALFEEGQSAFAHPIKLLYQFKDLPEKGWPLLFSVSVPKKKIKSAVDRNLVKRRIREAYRLHKHPLQEALQENDKWQLSLMLIHISQDIPPYDILTKAVTRLLNDLVHAIPE